MSSTRPRPRKLFNRKKVTKASYPVFTAITATVTLVAGKMRLTYPQPVVVSATPAAITANSLHPTGLTVVSSNVVDLAFATPPVATNPWVIPANVQEIKSATGGVTSAASGVF